VRLIEEWLKKPQIGNLPSLLPTEKSIPQVAFRYQAMRLCVRHPYLEDIRCIPPAVTSHWRFNGRLQLDGTGNEVFPHMDEKSVCGYEIKGPSCLVPAIDGAFLSRDWKEALWGKFYTGAPRRQRRSVERYNIVKRA
jgi:hypothetical protein